MFQQNLIILAICGQISDLYFLIIFWKKSKKTAVKSGQKVFSKKSATQNFQKWRSDRRNFCQPQTFGIINLDPKKSSDMRAPFFLPLFYDILSFNSIFIRNFWPCEGPLWPHRAVSGGRQKFLTQKKFFSKVILNPPQKAWEYFKYTPR